MRECPKLEEKDNKGSTMISASTLTEMAPQKLVSLETKRTSYAPIYSQILRYEAPKARQDEKLAQNAGNNLPICKKRSETSNNKNNA